MFQLTRPPLPPPALSLTPQPRPPSPPPTWWSCSPGCRSPRCPQCPCQPQGPPVPRALVTYSEALLSNTPVTRQSSQTMVPCTPATTPRPRRPWPRPTAPAPAPRLIRGQAQWLGAGRGPCLTCLTTPPTPGPRPLATRTFPGRAQPTPGATMTMRPTRLDRVKSSERARYYMQFRQNYPKLTRNRETHRLSDSGVRWDVTETQIGECVTVTLVTASGENFSLQINIRCQILKYRNIHTEYIFFRYHSSKTFYPDTFPWSRHHP